MSNGNGQHVAGLGNSYIIPINMGRLTAVFSGAIWAMRNGSTNKIKIRTIDLQTAFDGIASLDSAIYNLYRFSGANYTGGVAITPAKKNTLMLPSTLQDCRQSSVGALGSVGVVLESTSLLPIVNPRDKGATVRTQHELGFHDGISLNYGEGLALICNVVSVVGDSITGFVECEEL